MCCTGAQPCSTQQKKNRKRGIKSKNSRRVRGKKRRTARPEPNPMNQAVALVKHECENHMSVDASSMQQRHSKHYTSSRLPPRRLGINCTLIMAFVILASHQFLSDNPLQP